MSDTFSDLVTATMRSENWEPIATTREFSVREMKQRSPVHIRHRFAFKGGVTGADVMRIGMMQTNALFALLARKKLIQPSQ